MDGKKWFYCRCYEEVNEEIQDIIDKRNQLQKQNEWLVDRLAGCAAEKMGLPKQVMELSINAELDGMNK